MAVEKTNLLTAGAIAKELGVSGAVVSKAIKALGIQPEMKKGACSYYPKEAVKKIKASLK
ncbi:MAG: HTH domain-containing protein [bacterium]